MEVYEPAELHEDLVGVLKYFEESLSKMNGEEVFLIAYKRQPEPVAAGAKKELTALSDELV